MGKDAAVHRRAQINRESPALCSSSFAICAFPLRACAFGSTEGSPTLFQSDWFVGLHDFRGADLQFWKAPSHRGERQSHWVTECHCCQHCSSWLYKFVHRSLFTGPVESDRRRAQHIARLNRPSDRFRPLEFHHFHCLRDAFAHCSRYARAWCPCALFQLVAFRE